MSTGNKICSDFKKPFSYFFIQNITEQYFLYSGNLSKITELSVMLIKIFLNNNRKFQNF